MIRKLLPIFIFLISISSVIAQVQVNITFEVNTNQMASVSMDGIFISGGTGFGTPGSNPLTDPDGDGIWTITVQRFQGFQAITLS